MSSDLKYKTLHAVKWNFIQAVGLRGVQFVVGIILARLLLPEQFGLIGMLVIFMAVAQVFLDSGFGAALIQKQDITQKDICSIFYFNILVGVLVVGCLYVLAPWVATFYDQPILKNLLRVMSIVLVINAFGLVQNILLRKALNFKTETKVSLVASLLSGIVGVMMAYRGFGVWSLAAQQLSAAFFRTILLWILTSWRPAWIFSLQSLREMFGFSSKLLCVSLLNTIFDNMYYLVIGKLFPPTALGYYTRADNLQKLPSKTLSSVIIRVTFPVFSTIQDDPERVRRGMKKALTMLVLVNFPLMIGIAIVARPLVIALLTEKWLPCVPYLQLLCLVGLVYPLQLINLNVLQSLGRSDLFLRIEIIKKVLVVINIAITWRWGIVAMISGHVIISVVSYCLYAYYNKILLRYSLWDQIKDLCPYLLVAVTMGSAVYVLSFLPIVSPLMLLGCQSAAGVLMSLFLCRLFRLSAYMDLERIVFNRFSTTSPIIRDG